MGGSNASVSPPASAPSKKAQLCRPGMGFVDFSFKSGYWHKLNRRRLSSDFVGISNASPSAAWMRLLPALRFGKGPGQPFAFESDGGVAAY